MNRDELLGLLEEFRAGEISTESIVDVLSGLRVDNLEHSRFDSQRELRSGLPEVIYAEGKQTSHLIDLARTAIERNEKVLITRLRDEQIPQLRDSLPKLRIYPESRIAEFAAKGEVQEEQGGVSGEAPAFLAIVSAGTSDAAIAQEVELSAQFLGVSCKRIADVGVAGLPRLLEVLPEIRQAEVVVVVAGMEGALPSVVSGLIEAPIIAVPTSVGYGASFRGIAALLGMLVSCSPGVTVVNIDNGFGAALAAVKMMRHLRRPRAEG